MNSTNSILTRALLVLCVAALFAACKASTSAVSTPQYQVGSIITGDTLSGAIKGTMQAGKTYYFDSNLTINAGDTVVMQSGVSLLSLYTPSASGSGYAPMITVHGTFFSLGTQSAQNYIGPIPANRNPAWRFAGCWGGIQGDTTAGDLVIKWTHLEYAGGVAGAAALPSVYSPGDPLYMLEYQNPNSNLILEDSWFNGCTDDCVHINGAKASIMRNTFENDSYDGGESLNFKNGTIGNVAFNLFLGSCTNGTKISNAGGTGLECNIYVYNNTFVNTGWRQTETAHGGSVELEKLGSAVLYNNLFVNCQKCIRIPAGSSVGDTANSHYDYNYYYGQAAVILTEFYPPDGCQYVTAHNIADTTTPQDHNPMFVSYNVNQFDFTSAALQWPIDTANMPIQMMQQSGTGWSWNFNLASGSPAIGKGTTTAFVPLTNVIMRSNASLDADPTPPNADMGAYPTNGTGNQH
jgi:hypothetical protein